LTARRDPRDTAAGTAVVVTYLITFSTVRYVLPVLVSASVVFAIAVGVSRNRPPSFLPWCLFAAAMTPYAAADTIWGLYQIRDAEVPFPGVADMLYLGSYLMFAAGLVTPARAESTTPSEALRDADAALYRAKSAGKNRAPFLESP
jgi:hypothetical protein